MYEKVSVEEAISKAKRTIIYPCLAIFFASFIFIFLGAENLVPVWFAIAGGVLCFIPLPWLYWSFAIVRWRLWAFDNVRNVHELKKKAIKEQLIWRDGHWCGKTEIWMADQRLKWAQLEQKFKQPDLFEDDFTVPVETAVYYSKLSNYAVVAFGLIFIGAGLFVITTEKNSYITLIISVLLGGYMIYTGFKKATNADAQLILSNAGIQTASTPFYRWEEVSGEDVIKERSGKYVHYYLVYRHPTGHVKLVLGSYDTSAKQLEKLLTIYRGRSNKKNNTMLTV